MERNKKMYEILHSLEKDYGQHTWPRLVSESNPRLKELRKVVNASNSGRKMVIDFEEVKRSITDGFPSMYHISKRLGISRTVIERTIKENHELSELYKKRMKQKTTVVLVKNGHVEMFRTRQKLADKLGVSCMAVAHHIQRETSLNGYEIMMYPRFESEKGAYLKNDSKRLKAIENKVLREKEIFER